MKNNNPFYLKVKRLNNDSKLLYPAKHGDAGYDVFSTVDVTLKPNERFSVPLGIALEFPDGYFCQVNQKSGLAKKFGIDTIGNVIDSGYRGEIHAIVVNTSNENLVVTKGQKIAQLIFIPYVKSEFSFVSELSESERQGTGFGSTGI